VSTDCVESTSPKGGWAVSETTALTNTNNNNVQHHRVVILLDRPERAVLAVPGDIHGKAFLAQPAGQQRGELPVVFDDQQPHEDGATPGFMTAS
jgi:hypothetical protein